MVISEIGFPRRPGKTTPFLAPSAPRLLENLQGTRGQRYAVFASRLRPILRNRPDRLFQVERGPPRPSHPSPLRHAASTSSSTQSLVPGFAPEARIRCSAAPTRWCASAKRARMSGGDETTGSGQAAATWTTSALRADLLHGLDCAPRFVPSQALPRLRSAREDLGGVKLHAMGISGIDVLRQPVQLPGDPVRLRFEHRVNADVQGGGAEEGAQTSSSSGVSTSPGICPSVPAIKITYFM